MGYLGIEHHLSLDVGLKIDACLLSMHDDLRGIIDVHNLLGLKLKLSVFGQLIIHIVYTLNMLLKQ